MKLNIILLYILIAIPLFSQEQINIEKLNNYIAGKYINDYQITNDTIYACTDENIIYFFNDTIHNLIDGNFKNSAIFVRKNNIFLIKEEEGMFQIIRIKNNKIIRTKRLEYENIYVDFNQIYMAEDGSDNLFISMLDFSNNFKRPELIVFKLDGNLNIIKKFKYKNLSYNNFLFTKNNRIYLVLKYENNFSLFEFNNNEFKKLIDLDSLNEDNYIYMLLASYYFNGDELTIIYKKDKFFKIIIYNLNDNKLKTYSCLDREYESGLAFANIDGNIYFGIDTIFFKYNLDSAILKNIEFSDVDVLNNSINPKNSNYYCKLFLTKKINYISDIFIVLNNKIALEHCDKNMIFIKKIHSTIE